MTWRGKTWNRLNSHQRTRTRALTIQWSAFLGNNNIVVHFNVLLVKAFVSSWECNLQTYRNLSLYHGIDACRLSQTSDATDAARQWPPPMTAALGGILHTPHCGLNYGSLTKTCAWSDRLVHVVRKQIWGGITAICLQCTDIFNDYLDREHRSSIAFLCMKKNHVHLLLSPW